MSTRIEEKFIIPFGDIFHNPYFFIRSGLFKAIKGYSMVIKGSLLDFGCGTKPYKKLFTEVSKYTGVDFEGGGNNYKKSNVDVFYDGEALPFENDEFDNILSTEVIEHIFNPDQIISELNRVLKPGGLFLLTCPFLWPEHEQPWDYARYSSFGIRSLLKKHDFEIIEQQKTGNFITGIIQLIVLYIYMFIPKVPVLKQLLFLIFCFPFQLTGAILNIILPTRMKRRDMYLSNVVLARKKEKVSNLD